MKTIDPIRLGVIGTGSVVREIYQYLYFHSGYSEMIDVVAACDPELQSLEWFCDRYSIPENRRFSSYDEMIQSTELDAVAVNTPDSMHKEPAITALENDLDVLLPKPIASTVADAHEIIAKARRRGRFVGVDFHKRDDPVVKEARARFRSGEYGNLQTAVLYMLDRLEVADPNHVPRFFSSPDFAARNTPVSFLTSHMADTFMMITGLRPGRVSATGYRRKLPFLEPQAVEGYDLVDTTVVLEDASSIHIITGWSLPNTATALTVQSARFIFTDALLDLWNESYGFHETTGAGIEDRNVLFRNFERDGYVSGYGISNPGRLLEQIAAFRNAGPDAVHEDPYSPFASGVLTALVCDCAHASLAGGVEENGVIHGVEIDARTFLKDSIGDDAETYLSPCLH